MNATYKNSEQYARFAAAAHERLTAKGFQRAAITAGARLREDGALEFFSLGKTITVHPESYQVEGAFGMWHELVLLQYLADGDGRQPYDCWMGLANFEQGGLERGCSFDQEVRKLAAKLFTGYSARDIACACRALGGEDAESMGDVTYNFMLAPHFPLQALIWLSDDEFDASAKVLVDGSAEYYLGVEAAGLVACLLIEQIAANLPAREG